MWGGAEFPLWHLTSLDILASLRNLNGMTHDVRRRSGFPSTHHPESITNVRRLDDILGQRILG